MWIGRPTPLEDRLGGARQHDTPHSILLLPRADVGRLYGAPVVPPRTQPTVPSPRRRSYVRRWSCWPLEFAGNPRPPFRIGLPVEPRRPTGGGPSPPLKARMLRITCDRRARWFAQRRTSVTFHPSGTETPVRGWALPPFLGMSIRDARLACQIYAQARMLWAVTVTEAAERLRLSPATVRRQIANGRIKARKLGRDWDISEEEVRRYSALSRGRPGRRPKEPTLGLLES